jgi:hypothetical protein
MSCPCPAKASHCNIHISYWWRCERIPDGMPDGLIFILDNEAKRHIDKMLEQGYVEGELNSYVCFDVEGRKTPEVGWVCKGAWSVKADDGTEAKRHSTVNVIEFRGDTVISMASWEDNKEGNEAAESHFTAMLKENSNLSEDDIAMAIEDGQAEDGEWKAILVHSTVPASP